MSCRACKSEDLVVAFSLGDQPGFSITDLGRPPKELHCTYQPLDILFCAKCGYLQRDQLNIGSGHFFKSLNRFSDRSIKRLGDKIANYVDTSNPIDVSEYFEKPLVNHLVRLGYRIQDEENRKCGFILHDGFSGYGLFYNRFKGDRGKMSPGGLIVVILPILDTVLEDNKLGVFNPHNNNYFTVKSLVEYADRQEFGVIDFLDMSRYERAYFIMDGATTGYCIDGLMDIEKAKGLYDLQTYKEFSARCYKNLIEFGKVLLNDTRDKIIAGANPEMLCVIQYMKNNKIFPHEIKYIADDNYQYWSRYIGMLEVKSSEWLWLEENALVLNFTDEEIPLKAPGANIFYTPHTRII